MVLAIFWTSFLPDSGSGFLPIWRTCNLAAGLDFTAVRKETGFRFIFLQDFVSKFGGILLRHLAEKIYPRRSQESRVLEETRRPPGGPWMGPVVKVSLLKMTPIEFVGLMGPISPHGP